MTNRHVQRLEQLATASREAREKVAAQLAALKADTDHSAEWKSQQERAIRDAFQEIARELAAQRQTVLELAASDVPGDDRSSDQVFLEDGRISRRWSDLRADLEAGRSWRQLAADAVATGDKLTLAALADELPRYEAGRVPANRPGRREDVQTVMRNTTAALDQVIAEHGQGHRQAAAAHRLDVARADAIASIEVGAVADTAAGRFNQVNYGVSLHYAKQSPTPDTLARGDNLTDAVGSAMAGGGDD